MPEIMFMELGIYIVTWTARALLGNGAVVIPRPKTQKATTEELPFLHNEM
jgi:hypothetical protein